MYCSEISQPYQKGRWKMQQVGIITLVFLLFAINWMTDDSIAAESPPASAREISTTTEHYWVIEIDKIEKKHGPYIKRYPDGTQLVSGQYLNGEKDGQWIFRSKEGAVIKEENWKNGKRHGLWSEMYANGKKAFEGEYRRNVPLGVHHEWHMDGSLKAEIEHQVKGDQIAAVMKTWHPDGKPYTQYKMLNGKMHGTYTSWYPNGQIRLQCSYADGQRDGQYKEWYQNGKLKAEYTYDHSRKTGQSIEWFDNGHKKSEGTYANGKDGLWTTWDKDGLVVRQQKFQDGKQVQ